MKKMLLFALLFATVAGAAQAQLVWPTGNPYSCNWTLNGTSGNAFVTFLYYPYNPAADTRIGTIRNVYPNGSISTRPFVLSWNRDPGPYNRFDYVQTQDNISCVLTTVNSGRDVTFYPCSNGAWQHCVQ
jgi:hypothetical protein